jgi:hypothetical protein
MFAEWFEFRIEQNFANSRNFENDALVETIAGADDITLGCKLFLTEQDKSLPETSIIFKMFIPTGKHEFSNRKVLPALNYLCGWDLIDDCLTMGTGFQINGVSDDGMGYTEIAPSLTFGYILTKKLGAYTEWFALFASGADDPEIGPEHYADGGFTYKITNNFQLDIRAGVGLNDRATNFFTGAGASIRY